MNSTNPQLLEYIRGEVVSGVPIDRIKSVLLENDWSEDVVLAAFSELGIQKQQQEVPDTAVPTDAAVATEKTFASENITMDKIIEKFIPIAGALFLIIGFGYLIYANAWINLPMEMRIGLGFFFSLVIIGGSFSLPEKMRYFTDIGIGSGVLLFYGTLMYGSRTTELASAMIPEIVTLLTAVLFTLAVSYFASKRNSKVILILGMLGAYITPFVIGQNEVWVGNMSFNAYLIYFFAINVSIFLMGREISVRDIIPLNIIGLFVGVSTLWGLAYTDNINAVQANDIFTSEMVTAFLFMILVVFSIWSILLSAQRFRESDDGYLSLGYIAPVLWFAFNVANLESVSDVAVGFLYAIIAAACFIGWHVLLNVQTRFQHTALYASGLLSAFLAVFAFFEDFNMYTSMLIAYTSVIFGVLYLFDSSKTERFTSYIIVSLTGSILSLYHILESNPPFETVFIVGALLPAMSAYFIAKNGQDQSLVPGAKLYSILWAIVAGMFVLAELVDYIKLDFLLFYVLPLILLGYVAVVHKMSPEGLTHDSKSKILRLTLFWFAFGFVEIFFKLVFSIYPAPTNVYFFTHTDAPTDWVMIKGIFATAILLIGLWISRKLQLEQVIRRPSFLLVIFGFSTLLITGNYIISGIANDLGVSLESGGPRAIATTLWWVAIAILMLYKGVKKGKTYHSEKLLGLMLLGITIAKVILYDMQAMEMQNKIIVLMLVGGAMLLFSYVVRSKNLLGGDETQPQ